MLLVVLLVVWQILFIFFLSKPTHRNSFSKVFQRFHRFKGFWDRLLLITKDKKIAEDLSQNLTENGVSKDGRRDYEGIIG